MAIEKVTGKSMLLGVARRGIAAFLLLLLPIVASGCTEQNGLHVPVYGELG